MVWLIILIYQNIMLILIIYKIKAMGNMEFDLIVLEFSQLKN